MSHGRRWAYFSLLIRWRQNIEKRAEKHLVLWKGAKLIFKFVHFRHSQILVCAIWFMSSWKLSWLLWQTWFIQLSYPYQIIGSPTFIWSHFALRFFLPSQTQACHNVSVTPPAEKTVPGMAMLLGAVGIGMCGYSSRQLALHHRPSARVLQLVGTHTDASIACTVAQRTPFLDVTRWSGARQEIPPPSFAGQKVPPK